MLKREDGSGFVARFESIRVDLSNGSFVIRTAMSDISEIKLSVEALNHSREQLRALSTHLVKAREEERITIGREIHDELGQLLTAAIIELKCAKRKCGPNNSLVQKIGEVSELLKVAIEDIQRICTQLRPRLLDHLGLFAALEQHVAKFSERYGIKCILALPKHEVNLSDEVSTSLFRIIQEALNNVVRHSGADEVSVRLDVAGAVSLLIIDNGRGISSEDIVDTESYGIMGIKERALQLDGTITINGISGKGTTIRLTMPLKRQGNNT